MKLCNKTTKIITFSLFMALFSMPVNAWSWPWQWSLNFNTISNEIAQNKFTVAISTVAVILGGLFWHTKKNLNFVRKEKEKVDHTLELTTKYGNYLDRVERQTNKEIENNFRRIAAEKGDAQRAQKKAAEDLKKAQKQLQSVQEAQKKVADNLIKLQNETAKDVAKDILSTIITEIKHKKEKQEFQQQLLQSSARIAQLTAQTQAMSQDKILEENKKMRDEVYRTQAQMSIAQTTLKLAALSKPKTPQQTYIEIKKRLAEVQQELSVLHEAKLKDEHNSLHEALEKNKQLKEKVVQLQKEINYLQDRWQPIAPYQKTLAENLRRAKLDKDSIKLGYELIGLDSNYAHLLNAGTIDGYVQRELIPKFCGKNDQESQKQLEIFRQSGYTFGCDVSKENYDAFIQGESEFNKLKGIGSEEEVRNMHEKIQMNILMPIADRENELSIKMRRLTTVSHGSLDHKHSHGMNATRSSSSAASSTASSASSNSSSAILLSNGSTSSNGHASASSTYVAQTIKPQQQSFSWYSWLFPS